MTAPKNDRLAVHAAIAIDVAQTDMGPAKRLEHGRYSIRLAGAGQHVFLEGDWTQLVAFMRRFHDVMLKLVDDDQETLKGARSGTR